MEVDMDLSERIESLVSQTCILYGLCSCTWKKCLCSIIQAQAEFVMNHNLFYISVKVDVLVVDTSTLERYSSLYSLWPDCK